MFTKGHYKVIAEVISTVLQEADKDKSSIAGLSLLVDKLASLFEMDNPGFDREKFVSACMNMPKNNSIRR